jgi:hypothetical protein
MADVIRFVLGNFTLTFLVIGLIATGIALVRAPRPLTAAVEVGFASLGFAVVGFLAFRRSFDLRLAAVVGPALFLLGAAGGHIYQMITARNFAPGNAGVIFYTDLAIPVIGLVLLWLQRRWELTPEPLSQP